MAATWPASCEVTMFLYRVAEIPLIDGRRVISDVLLLVDDNRDRKAEEYDAPGHR